MHQATKFWAQKLEREAPGKLPEFWAYIKAGFDTDTMGQGGESAYWWALKH